MKAVAGIILLGAFVQTLVGKPSWGSWAAGVVITALAFAPWDRLNAEKRRRR